MTDFKKQGKKNRRKGSNFELQVRHYLESQGWIVCKWANQVEFPTGMRTLPNGREYSKEEMLKLIWDYKVETEEFGSSILYHIIK